MFFLGKVFQLRGKAHGEEEKPFLDHLEDLRMMITRVVITLLLSTIICWVFHKKIIDIISKPVHEVWNAKQTDKLPTEIEIDHWEKIKKVQQFALLLEPADRESYYQSFEDEKMQLRAESARYYSVALTIEDEEKRQQWIDQLEELSAEHKELIKVFLEKRPDADPDAKSKVVDMKSLKPTETFMLAFKLAFFAGLVISFPLTLMFVLQFVLPGLKATEKKVMWPAMLIGFGLFLSGVLFAYFIVLPRALDFFFNFGNDMGVQNEWRIGDYAGFVTQFTLIFGLAFELPVVVMTLVKIGLVGYKEMSNTRSYAVLGIIVIAAAITPTSDILTLSMLAVPMYLLYEFCIILAYFDYRKEQRLEREEYERTGVRQSPKVSAGSGLIELNSDDEEEYDDEEEFECDADDDGSDYDDDYHETGDDLCGEYEDDDYDYDKDHEEMDFDEDDYDEHGCQEYKHFNDGMHHDVIDDGFSGFEKKEGMMDGSECDEGAGDEGDSDSYDDNLKEQDSDEDGDANTDENEQSSEETSDDSEKDDPKMKGDK